MFQHSLNNVIIKIKHKYIGNITDIMKVAAIQNNSSVQIADIVNIVGEVVSVPLEISTWRREFKGFSARDIKVGDTAIFSHDVIHNFTPNESTELPIFKNSFWYKDAEYWKCNIIHLYAVIRNEEIRMQNGYVMVGNMEKPSGLILPQRAKKMTNTATATVSHIEMNPTIKRGDKIYFNPNKLRLYQIDGKPFGILKKSQILGRDYRIRQNGTGRIA